MKKLIEINTLNVNSIVPKTYVHDFFVEKFEFDFLHKTLCFSAANSYNRAKYKFLFDDVQHLTVEADEKWGPPNGVLHAVENEEMALIDGSSDLVTLKFMFTSGDTIIVVAGKIAIEIEEECN